MAEGGSGTHVRIAKVLVLDNLEEVEGPSNGQRAKERRCGVRRRRPNLGQSGPQVRAPLHTDASRTKDDDGVERRQAASRDLRAPTGPPWERVRVKRTCGLERRAGQNDERVKRTSGSEGRAGQKDTRVRRTRGSEGHAGQKSQGRAGRDAGSECSRVARKQTR